MKISIKKDIDWLTLLSWILIIGIAIYIVYLHFQTIFYPYSNEFREGHMMGTTDLLLKGINPYGFEKFPNYYNSYGILYSLVVYPFALLFGNSLDIHRVVTEIFVLASLFLLYNYNKKSVQKNTLISSIFFLLIYSLLLIRGTCGVRPDGLGMFLFLCSVLIPIKNNFSNKSFFYSGLFALLAFYTKSYFLIGWIAIAATLLFTKNYKKLIISNLLFGVVFLIVAIIISKLMPLYFYETIFAYNGSSDISIKFSFLQMTFFFVTLSPIFILVFLLILNKTPQKNIKDNLLHNKLSIVSIITFIILIFPLGINNGAFVIYHNQLLLPIIIILLIPLFIDININKTGKIIILISAFLLSLQTIYFSRNIETPKGEWKEMENYIKNKSNILNSAVIAPLLIKQEKNIYETGVTGFISIYKSNTLTNLLFGHDKKIEIKIQSFFNDIDYKLINKKFDAIIISKKDESLYNISKVRKYYILKKTLHLKLPQSTATEEVFIYEPK